MDRSNYLEWLWQLVAAKRRRHFNRREPSSANSSPIGSYMQINEYFIWFFSRILRMHWQSVRECMCVCVFACATAHVLLKKLQCKSDVDCYVCAWVFSFFGRLYRSWLLMRLLFSIVFISCCCCSFFAQLLGCLSWLYPPSLDVIPFAPKIFRIRSYCFYSHHTHFHLRPFSLFHFPWRRNCRSIHLAKKKLYRQCQNNWFLLGCVPFGVIIGWNIRNYNICTLTVSTTESRRKKKHHTLHIRANERIDTRRHKQRDKSAGKKSWKK